jgi:hypothetical protein
LDGHGPVVASLQPLSAPFFHRPPVRIEEHRLTLAVGSKTSVQPQGQRVDLSGFPLGGLSPEVLLEFPVTWQCALTERYHLANYALGSSRRRSASKRKFLSPQCRSTCLR